MYTECLLFYICSQLKAVRGEFLAIVKLLDRSCVNSLNTTRNFSTSTCFFEKEKESNQKNNEGKEPQKPPHNDEQASSNSNKQSSNSKRSDDKKQKKKFDEQDRNNNMNRAMAILTKAILWTALIYSIIFTLIVVKSILNGGQSGNSEHFTVSWKEFVQYMLAAGEVKELIIRPQYDYVRVILHDGAIINGRRPRFTTYLLQVPSTDQFEERLREVERRMGIVESMIYTFQKKNSLCNCKLYLQVSQSNTKDFPNYMVNFLLELLLFWFYAPF